MTATPPASAKWNRDKCVFHFAKVHCLHCDTATDSLGNTKIHVQQCRGLYDVSVICGCCGRKYDRWRRLFDHINQGSFHRRQSSLAGYDGTSASILAHAPAAASQMINDNSEVELAPLDRSPNTPTAGTTDHEIFLEPPASPDFPPFPNDSLLNPSVNLYMAQTDLVQEQAIDLDLSLHELEDLLRQYPPSFDLPAPSIPASLQLPCPVFPNLFMDEPPTAADTSLITPPNPPPPTPTTGHPSVQSFHACCRPACNYLLAQGCYYKDLAQQFAIMLSLAHSKLNDLSPVLFSAESPDDCPHQKLLREGPWTYQVSRIPRY